MSLVENQKLCFWKDLLTQSRGLSDDTYGDLRVKEHHTVAEAKLLWVGIIADHLGLDPVSDSRSIRRLAGGIFRLTLDQMVQGCDAMRDFLTHYDSRHGIRVGVDREFRGGLSYATFKQWCRGIMHERFLEVLFRMKRLIEPFLANPTASTFFPLNEIFVFPMRLNVSREDLKEELTQAYKDFEEHLSFRQIPILSQAKEWIEEVMKDFSLIALLPHHGPGATANAGRQPWSKWANLGADDLLIDFIRNCNGNPWEYYPTIPGMLERRSKLVFVPKSLKTLRSINEEEAGIMFWQQAVKDQLYAYIDSHPLLGRIIILDDASINGAWASAGSRTGDFATVDLSSASDSVTWDLVQYLFKDTTLYPALRALRSTTCSLPTGEVIPLKKFAPMGSALCFPIECLVFAALAAANIRQATNDDVASFLKVYGDDIVIHDYFANSVISTLTDAGFTVNTEKSFHGYDTAFRESCGLEAYLGVDVTPLRIGRKFRSIRDIPGGLRQITRTQFTNSIRPLYNKAVERGYFSLRSCLMILLDRGSMIFSHDPNEGFLSSEPTNFHLKRDKQLEKELFTSVYKVKQLVAWAPPCSSMEEVRLWNWFSCAARRKSDDPIVSSITNTKQRVSTRSRLVRGC